MMVKPFTLQGAKFGGALHELTCQKSAVEAQPLIAVRNVRASSRWYADLLAADALPDHPHRDVYDRIWRSGRMLLQLHAWDAEDHPNLVNADAAPRDTASCYGSRSTISIPRSSALARLGAEIVEDTHFNPAPRHREIWLRDPEGYVVDLASPDGESGS